MPTIPDVPKEVAMSRPDLFLICVFMLTVLVLVLLLIRYVFKRQGETDAANAQERQLAAADRQQHHKNVKELTERFIVASKEQSDACHTVSKECMGMAQGIQREANEMFREMGEHLAMHREAVRDCDRCGNYRPTPKPQG